MIQIQRMQRMQDTCMRSRMIDYIRRRQERTLRRHMRVRRR